MVWHYFSRSVGVVKGFRCNEGLWRNWSGFLKKKTSSLPHTVQKELHDQVRLAPCAHGPTLRGAFLERVIRDFSEKMTRWRLETWWDGCQTYRDINSFLGRWGWEVKDAIGVISLEEVEKSNVKMLHHQESKKFGTHVEKNWSEC